MASDAQLQTRVERLACERLVGGKSIRQIAEEMDLSQPYLYKLMKTPEYEKIESQVREKFTGVTGEFIERMTDAVKKMMPVAIARLEDELLNSLDPKMIRWAVDSVLDRGGVVKQARVEQKVSVELSAETIRLLALADKETTAIELHPRDWSYATQRPSDERRMTNLSSLDPKPLALESHTSEDPTSGLSPEL